jgi:two-component sensor histidine kinase/PAS domain-containing protein
VGEALNNRLSGQRILVVEDEGIVAWALEDMLADMGCAVVGTAARVNQALAMIDDESIDAVVLDLNLNGQMSYPVADVLASRGMPFVFLTGYHKSSIPEAYVRFPMMQKPLDRSRLGDALTQLLTPGFPSPSAPTTDSSVWDTNRLRIATDAAGVGLWSWNVDRDQIDLDARAHSLWDVPAGSVTFEDLSAQIHPEDLDRVRAAFAAMREVLGAYEVDFRILHTNEVRWVSTRGRGDDRGIVGRIMFGVFLDVTERKLAEEAREMLADEMGHRVKNFFALASALTRISERSTSTSAEMFRDLTQRLTALSLAHDLIRPVLSEPRKAARLSDLLAVLLRPYAQKRGVGDCVRVSVPELLVGEASATTLALVVHELATNSIKYGALSMPTGTIAVSGIDHDGSLSIIWLEQGGPTVTAPKGGAGFGTQLIIKSISGQLGGTIAFDWRSDGIIVTLSISIARLGG